MTTKKQSHFTNEIVERNGKTQKVYTLRLGRKAIIQIKLTYTD